MRRVVIILAALVGSISASAQTTMEQFLAAVEAGNPTLQAAGEMASAEAYSARIANNLADPHVGYEYGWNVPSESGTEQGLSVSQEFDFPTAYINRGRVAEGRVAAAESDLRALRAEILLEAQLGYMEYVTLDRTLQLKRERADHSERAAEIFTRMANSGEVSLPDLSKARHAAIAAREAVVMTQMELADKSAALRAMTGGEQVLPTDYTAQLVEPMEQMLDTYLTSDPSLLSAKSREEAATAELKVEKNMALPKLSVGFTVKQGSGGNRVNAISSGISIPIFSSRATVKRAAAEQRAASAEVRAVEVECRTRLEALYEQMAIIGESQQMLREMVDDGYPQMLTRLLESGQIGAVEYFSELGSYYDAQESLLRLNFEADKIAAEINKIYL